MLIVGVVVGVAVLIILVIVLVCCLKKMKREDKASNVPMKELRGSDSLDGKDVEGMYAKVDKSAKRDKPSPDDLDKMYAKVNKNNTPNNQAPKNNDYDDLAAYQDTASNGATAKSPEELSSMYAQVQKNPKPEPSIYSELGPGGRVGPKPVVAPSNYAEAKDVYNDYDKIVNENGGGASSSKQNDESAYAAIPAREDANTYDI